MNLMPCFPSHTTLSWSSSQVDVTFHLSSFCSKKLAAVRLELGINGQFMIILHFLCPRFSLSKLILNSPIFHFPPSLSLSLNIRFPCVHPTKAHHGAVPRLCWWKTPCPDCLSSACGQTSPTASPAASSPTWPDPEREGCPRRLPHCPEGHLSQYDPSFSPIPY